MKCPECGKNEGFEKRAERRTYHSLDENLELDTWSEGDDFTFDTFESGEEIIYCLHCDASLTEAELRNS